MKFGFAIIALITASFAFAQYPTAPAGKDAKKTAPADKKKAADTKAEEPEAKIEGMAIARPDGRFLGLEVKDSKFVLSFYDKNKKEMAPDVARATMRWPVKYQPGDERTVLNPAGDGKTLTSGKTVKPPHFFKVYMSLFVEGSDEAVESYAVDYRSP